MRLVTNPTTHTGRTRKLIWRAALLVGFVLAGPDFETGLYGPSARAGDPPSSSEKRALRKATKRPRRRPPGPRPAPKTSAEKNDPDFVGPPSDDELFWELKGSELDKPYDQRTYQFSIKNGTYADLLDGFSRASGLSIIGDPPDGTLTNVSTEEMDFKTALNRVRLLLFKHPKQYWLLPAQNGYEIVRVAEGIRVCPIDRIYPSLKEFLEANLDDNELALLLYTPPSGSIEDLEPIRDLMPDYVRIARYAETNSVTIFALVRDINKYLELIDKFSVAGDDPRVIEPIPVQTIRASQALNVLKQMIGGFDAPAPRRGGRKAGPGPQTWGIDAYADDANERIIVKAVPDKITEIKELMPLIDFAPEGGFEPVVIQLQHQRVDKLLSIIQPILSGTPAPQPRRRTKRGKARAPATVRSDDLTILPQPETNSLIVVADEEQLEEVRQLVAQFDVPQPPGFKRIELETADPAELAPMLQQMMADAYKGSSVKVTPDPNASIVTVFGTEKEIQDAEKLVAMLDVEPAGGPPTLHRVRLTNAKPSMVVTMLRAVDSNEAPKAAPTPKGKRRTRRPARTSATGDKFQGDDSTRMLYVFCTDEEWNESYWPLIQGFDTDAEPDVSLETITLEQGDSNDVVESIQPMLATLKLDGEVQLVPGSGQITVIGATPGQLEQIRKFAAHFDVSGDEGMQRRTFTLTYIEPAQMMGVIRTLILDESASPTPHRRPRGQKGQPAPVTPISTGDVRMAELGPSLLVWAPADTMAEIAELIEQLDVPDDKNDLRVYEFARGTDVRELAQTLTSFFPGSGVTAQAGSRGKKPQAAAPTGGVLFVPQPSANKILVSAPTDVFPEIEATIEKLRTDEELGPGIQVAFFPIEHAEPESIAPLLEDFLKMKYAEAVETGAIKGGATAKGAAPGASTILVESDAQGGRLMVVGPAILIPEAQALLSELDRPGDGERIIRTVQLDRAEAEEMVQAVRAMLSGRQPTPTPRRAKRGGKPGQSIAIGGPSDVNVIAAPGGNSVVLVGYPHEVEEVEGWIKQLDAEASGGKILKVFTFVRADVEMFADAVMTLIDSGGGTGKPKSTGDEFSVESFGGPRRGKDVSLVTDPFGGTMLASTTPAKMREIDELYAKFEGTGEEAPSFGKSEPGGPTLMYTLKYADAYDAVFNLEALLEAVFGEENAPKVDYIPFTDILIIRGKPDLFPQVQDLIAEYIDKESEADKGLVYKPIRTGDLRMTPEELLRMLQLRTPNIPIEIIQEQPDKVDYNDLLEQVTPTSPAAPETEDEKENENNEEPSAARYVVPSSLMAVAEAVVAGAVAFSEPPLSENSNGPATEEPVKPTTEPVAEQPGKPTTQPAAGEKPSRENILRSVVGGGANKEEEKPQGIQIRVDPKTGTLIAVGRSKDIADLQYVLDKIKEEMEGVPMPPDIRVYRLKFIDVRVASQILESMFNAPRQQLTPQQRAAQQRAARQAQQQKGQPQPGQPPEEEKGQRPKPGEQQPQPAPAPAETTGGIRVFPDTRTRTLIIRAATEDFPTIVELLATIDKTGGKATDFKIIELKKLNAAEVEEMLKDLLGIGKQTSRTRRLPRGTNPAQAAAAVEQMQEQIMQFEMAGMEETAINIAEEVKIASNPATNTIMVMGPHEGITLVEEFIDKLESQEAPGREVRPYVLQFADATDVAPQLEKLFKGGGRTGGKQDEGFNPIEINAPTVVVDTRRNALIVNALSIDFPKIEPLIKELDRKADIEVKVMEFPTQFADAVKLAKTLNNIYGETGKGRGKPSTKKVQIVGDPETNTIFVSAPPELRDEITERITNAEAKAEAEAKPKVLKLQEAVPSAVAQKLREAFGQDRRGQGNLNITGDDATKQLFVRAPAELMPEIESLVQLLDQPSEDIGIRIFKLKFARAPEVLDQMNTMVRGLLGQLRGSSVQLDVFSATADARSNALVVMGGPTTFRLVEQVLESIDQPTAAPIAVETMVYALQRARADDVARTINSLFRDRRDGIDPPRAEANASTNTVLVRGTQDQHREIKEKVIDKLEEYAGTPAVPLLEKTFALQHVKADDTAATLRQWFTDRQTALKSASPQGALNPADTTVSVTPMVESNELVVLASQENLQRIEERLAELDQEGVGAMSARVTRMYLMKYLDPGQFAQAVNDAYRKSGRVAEKDQVSTTVIGSTQSVVVTASEENHEKIRELHEQMDVDTVATARRTRRFELKEANSDELAQKLAPLFREAITTRRGDKPIQIISEPKTNSLLIYANDQEFEQIEAVVRSVDVKTDPERDRVFKTFKLTYAESWGVVQMIQQIFQGSRNPRDQVTASADWGSNTLLVTASPDNMERVDKIIAEVDKKDASQRTVRVVELEHADPAGVVRSLNEMFRTTGRRGQDTVSISHTEGTNTLLIKANETEFEEIQAVLAQLDTAGVELGEIRTFTLEFTDAAEMKEILENYLQRPGGRGRGAAPLAGDIRISVSNQTNSLIVSGDREEVERLAAVIEKIDVEVTDAGTAPKILVLQHALPSVLEPTLSKMFVESSGKGGRGGRGGPASLVPVIVPDDTSKSLIVRANPVDFNQIKDLVDRLDTEDAAGEGGFKIIQLQAGVNVAEMADTLQGLLDEAARFEAEQRPGVKPQRVAIRADTRTNSILVAGARSRFTQVEDLVHRLEGMGPLGGRTTVVVPTKNIDPDEIRAVIDRMIEENRGESSTRRGGSQPRRRSSSRRR